MASYLGYAISSAVIGLYWATHHFAGAIYRSTGHYLNLATVLFLAAIGFIAFPARVFAEHVADPARREDSAEFLALGLAATSVAWLIKWTVARGTGHIDERLDPGYVRRLDRLFAISTAVIAAAAALTFVNWAAGIALTGLVTLYYVRPPRTPEYRTDLVHVPRELDEIARTGVGLELRSTCPDSVPDILVIHRLKSNFSLGATRRGVRPCDCRRESGLRAETRRGIGPESRRAGDD